MFTPQCRPPEVEMRVAISGLVGAEAKARLAGRAFGRIFAIAGLEPEGRVTGAMLAKDTAVAWTPLDPQLLRPECSLHR